MRNNTTASFNTAIGADALRENTISEANVAIGDSALTSYNGTDPGIDGFNTALGSIALTALTEWFPKHGCWSASIGVRHHRQQQRCCGVAFRRWPYYGQ